MSDDAKDPTRFFERALSVELCEKRGTATAGLAMVQVASLSFTSTKI